MEVMVIIDLRNFIYPIIMETQESGAKEDRRFNPFCRIRFDCHKNQTVAG